jgi:hypothetical protein
MTITDTAHIANLLAVTGAAGLQRWPVKTGTHARAK